ncbi:MAG: hypothetical protein J5594_00915 [Elusimicrobiaceae bacterium]|nr:hypothetical protein [Elusimicrobiaceae bacterium]
MKKVCTFISSNWIQLCWMIIALLFIAQVCGIRTELKRIAFGIGQENVFLMNKVESIMENKHK